MLEENRVPERITRGEVTRRLLVDFIYNSTPTDVAVADPTLLGERGYIPGGPNQPYAANIANAMANQNVTGTYSYPRLDPNARRFLADYLQYRRPDVFGPNPTVVRDIVKVSEAVLKDLRKMD